MPPFADADPKPPMTAIGLMSGTSLDGVDAALLVTDGERIVDFGPALTEPYPVDFRRRMKPLLGHPPDAATWAIVDELTDRHADAVRRLLAEAGLAAADVDVVGLHGQTVWHRPVTSETVQIGDGQRLADALGCPVVGDFRAADVAAGGQGAPFAPLYHAARAADLEKPLAVVNIGGVANVTWLGPHAPGEAPPLLAFDTGPGNALLDDWSERHLGRPVDHNGALAAAGSTDSRLLDSWLAKDYFRAPPPKSLDRDEFRALLDDLAGVSPADGAATLTALTCHAIAAAEARLPAPPLRWLICGGGRHNPTLMTCLRSALPVPVQPVEAVGWRGDYLEAEAFAVLAVRSLRGLPLSLPSTTGVPWPMTGGVRHAPTAGGLTRRVLRGALVQATGAIDLSR